MNSTSPTSTIGIDLAARSKNTAFCAIKWGEGAPVLTHLCRGKSSDDGIDLHDKYLTNLLRGNYSGFEDAPITKAAIDAPFGWPLAFVEAVGTFSERLQWRYETDFIETPEYIDSLRLRQTDLFVRDESGREPLSVSSTLLATVAMRCAGILGNLEYTIDDGSIRRDGSGLVVEVYPDPAIRFWTTGVEGGLESKTASYKSKDHQELRATLCRALTEPIDLEDPQRLLDQCSADDHCLDALVCALIARAVELGETAPPPPELAEAAEREGWIHLPMSPISALR